MISVTPFPFRPLVSRLTLTVPSPLGGALDARQRHRPAGLSPRVDPPAPGGEDQYGFHRSDGPNQHARAPLPGLMVSSPSFCEDSKNVCEIRVITTDPPASAPVPGHAAGVRAGANHTLTYDSRGRTIRRDDVREMRLALGDDRPEVQTAATPLPDGAETGDASSTKVNLALPFLKPRFFVGVFFLVYLAIGLSIYKDYGISWDER